MDMLDKAARILGSYLKALVVVAIVTILCVRHGEIFSVADSVLMFTGATILFEIHRVQGILEKIVRSLEKNVSAKLTETADEQGKK